MRRTPSARSVRENTSPEKGGDAKSPSNKKTATPKARVARPVTSGNTSARSANATAQNTIRATRRPLSATNGREPARRAPSSKETEKEKEDQVERDIAEVEAEIAELDAQIAIDEAETQQAESEALAAELHLTDETAKMLHKYSETQNEIASKETELSQVRKDLDILRSENLELCYKNNELSTEDRKVNKMIREAEEIYEKITCSQGSLDADLVQKLADCEAVRLAAMQSEKRFRCENEKFMTMKARLLEASAGTPSPETLQLVAEDDAAVGRCETFIEDIGKLAKEGVRPSLVKVPSSPTTPDSISFDGTPK